MEDPHSLLQIQRFERCHQIGKDQPFPSESEDENDNRRNTDYDADLVRVNLGQRPNVNSRINGKLQHSSDPTISHDLVQRCNRRGVHTQFDRFFIAGPFREGYQFNHGGLLAQQAASEPACREVSSALPCLSLVHRNLGAGHYNAVCR